MAENNMDEVMVEKALKGLKASYDMYETTKKETKNKMNKETFDILSSYLNKN